MTRFASRFCGFVLLAAGVAEAAAPATVLDTYLANLKTLRAEFSQVVVDGRGGEVQRATGKFVIQRPGKFRWELVPDAGAGGAQSPQLMIADGKNLWFYDRDLEQVSVKPAATALTATPASLLSGDGLELRASGLIGSIVGAVIVTAGYSWWKSRSTTK